MVLCFNKVKGEGNGVTMDEMMAKRAMLALESLGSVVITDAEGRYIYVSAQRLRKGGYKLEDLIGKYVRDVYPDTLVDQVLQTRQPVFLCPLLTPTLYGVQQNFVSYYPLVDGNECLGCFLYTTFGGMNSALEFTHIVTELSREVAQTRKQLQSIQKKSANYTTADIIGQSPAINQLKREISMVARTCSNVLIQGETGTGKELVAHSIHNLSRRCGAPFLRVNCSAIPEHLMESEFFGYEEGAFTGAKRGGKAGKFERASGGSLFLDEVNTLPMNMQPKFFTGNPRRGGGAGRRRSFYSDRYSYYFRYQQPFGRACPVGGVSSGPLLSAECGPYCNSTSSREKRGHSTVSGHVYLSVKCPYGTGYPSGTASSSGVADGTRLAWKCA